MYPIRKTAALLGACALSACAGPDAVERAATPDTGPPGAPPGTCWAAAYTPATVETVTEQVLVEPAAATADGRLIWPAVYRTETRQNIVDQREASWFETPCPDDMTEDVVASLQRALNVRGFYTGPINGRMDMPTRTAVRRYQTEHGIESGILSLEAARSLGLVVVPVKS